MSIFNKAKKKEKTKKLITIEFKGGKQYIIKASLQMKTAEMCDALLGAFATVAKYMVAEGMPPEVLKELTMLELDKHLQIKQDPKAREEEDDDN